MGYLSKSFVTRFVRQMVEKNRFLETKFWEKNFGRKKRGGKKSIYPRILAHRQSQRVDLTTTIIRRTVIREKKERENRNNKSCCGYKRHTCLKEGWKACISDVNGQRLKYSRNPSNRQIPRIFSGMRFRKYTLHPLLSLSPSLFTKPCIIPWL